MANTFSAIGSASWIAAIEAGAAYQAFRKTCGEIVAQEARVEAASAFGSFSEGDYADHITVDSDGSVGSTWFTAHFIEWGTVDTPAFGIMRRAVSRAGMRLTSD